MFSDEFDIIRSVGAGATADVYLARRKSNGESVALKVFSPKLLDNPEVASRLAEEATTLARLNHGNIVRLIRTLNRDATVGLELEFVDGEDLTKFRSNFDVPFIEPLVWVLAQVCKGLGGAHEQGILHRDLKPENILVSFDGDVKISDFGLARCIDRRTITRSGLFIGSLGYMAPEVIDGERPTVQSDIFSLGVVAYEILAQASPFPGETPQQLIRAIAEGKYVPLKSRAPHLSPRLQATVEACLQLDAKKRPESVWHVEAELMAELTQSGLLAVCKKLVSRGLRDSVLAECYRIKHAKLEEQVALLGAVEPAEHSARFRGSLFAIGAELHRLFPDDRERQARVTELMQQLNQPAAQKSFQRPKWFTPIAGMLSGMAVVAAAVGLWNFTALFQGEKTEPVVANPSVTRSNDVNIPAQGSTLVPLTAEGRDASADGKTPAPVAVTEKTKTKDFTPTIAGAAPAGDEVRRRESGRKNNQSEPKEIARPVRPVNQGSIKFDVDPDVDVFVNGFKVSANEELPIAAGVHKLRLLKRGFDPIENTVTVKAGKTSLIRVRSQQ
jgi:serine/threonine protein kinase